MTATTLPLLCLEAAASLKKCMEEQEHADDYFCMDGWPLLLGVLEKPPARVKDAE
jgi:hypothetical protein